MYLNFAYAYTTADNRTGWDDMRVDAPTLEEGLEKFKALATPFVLGRLTRLSVAYLSPAPNQSWYALEGAQSVCNAFIKEYQCAPA